MKLTPLDIRKQEFSTRLRGYDPEEVRAFLDMAAAQWEEIRDERQGLDGKLGEMQAKLDHYQQVEKALEEALRVAQESSEKTMRNAEEQARTLVEKAELEARETEAQARRTVHEIRRQASSLNDYRLELIARLRALLASETELLARYEEHASAVLDRLYAIGESEANAPPAEKAANGKSAARDDEDAARKGEEAPEAEDAGEEEDGDDKDSSSDIQHIRRILSDLD